MSDASHLPTPPPDDVTAPGSVPGPASAAPAGTSAGAPGGIPMRQFTLVKDGQSYVFRCAAGEEAQLLAEIAQMVREPASELSWFDAATLSQQISRYIGSMLK